MVDLTKTVRIELNRAGPSGDVELELRDLARRAELETKLLDLSATRELRRLLEICVPEAAPCEAAPTAAAPPETAPGETASPETAPRETAPAWNVTSTQILTLEPAAVARLAQEEAAPSLAGTQKLAPPPAALDCTIYDGGALRDYAQALAAGATEQPEAETATSEVADAPSRPSQRALGARFARLSAHFQQLPRSRKLILGLLPLALATRVLAMHPREQTPVPAGAHRAPHSAVALAVPAVPSGRPTLSVLEPPHLQAASRALSSPSAAPTSASAEAPPNPKDAALAHAALRAAFDGNAREAIAAYERLGQGPGGEPFRLAARLVRDNRVRKP